MQRAQPDGEQIEFIVRAADLTEKADSVQPWAVFLRGEPGF